MNPETSQLMQAILVASSALIGFGGLLVIEVAKLAKGEGGWGKVILGVPVLGLGTGFVVCIESAITWYQLADYASSYADRAVTWFNVQFFSFLLLLLVYVAAKFWSND